MKNPAAVALGRMAKGVPKTLTAAQRKFRGRQLAAARKKRHDKPERAARLPNGAGELQPPPNNPN